MEEKYYEILRHYVNPNDCATVVKQLLSLHNVVGQSEQLFCGVKDGFCPYEESDRKCRAEHKCTNQVAK